VKEETMPARQILDVVLRVDEQDVDPRLIQQLVEVGRIERKPCRGGRDHGALPLFSAGCGGSAFELILLGKLKPVPMPKSLPLEIQSSLQACVVRAARQRLLHAGIASDWSALPP
jgi:hypothetical protein